jgi:hypothetical protein
VGGKEMTTEELEIWRKLNECKAVKKVKGLLELGDVVCFRNKIGRVSEMQVNHNVANKREYVTVHVNLIGWIEEQYLTWLPPLYDPIRPERSLWGMSAGIREEWSVMQAGIFIASERPDLFLAEMIIEQEGK